MNETRLAGAKTAEHWFSLPLDYSDPDGPAIKVFAREVWAADKMRESLPMLVFFQGGPGFGALRPLGRSGWLDRALEEFRVLLLDQRGTGRSSPIHAGALAPLSPDRQFHYLCQHRADNIVRDAEAIRRQLLGERPWSILGQSFGGFCVLRYLSAAHRGLKEAYITGGIPSLVRSADEVYRATFLRVAQKNQAFFSRFPGAQALADRIAAHLSANEVRLPDGARLTVERFQLLGIHLGMEEGPEALYYLMEQALLPGPSGETLNPLFLHGVMQMLDYDTNPIFSLLHEPIYNQGRASRWAAHRIRQEYPEFGYRPDRPLKFTGEMIFPWMFDQFEGLKPMASLARRLAEHEAWPPLYDLGQLASNPVPTAAAVYTGDMFVEQAYSEETIEQVANLTAWRTSEYEHNGIRMDGYRILDRLIDLNRQRRLR
ncbi:alpha/beta hydrolase [Ferrimonas sediminicola]|uniref:Alpha/beta hydrolase n=1 Tax=Ferrimonas sediminicola TaxID=2569538 RepID=A0A4U1B9D1_9GAMM|nr:alpha/beta fold hydrolase [Ferrimonas sediminicola]TKB47357.1 alpha/beta hydrolase [Ferrimonas sediminicola]